MTDGIEPILTVAAVTERDGRFLVVEELIRGQPVINQPAGHVEQGEPLLTAVVRETLEETAWQFQPEAVTGLYLWQAAGTARPFLRVVFCGRCTDHDPQRRLDEGVLRALWLSREELSARPPAQLRSPMVMRAIDDYLGGVRHPIPAIVELATPELVARAQTL